MKGVLLLVGILLVYIEAFDQEIDWEQAKSIHEFYGEDIDGNPIKLNQFDGSVLLLANVASKCGLTETNYRQLGEICTQFDGVQCIYYPSGDFKNQEYSTNEEIKTEAVPKYNITQLMMSKGHVTGEDAQPVFKWINKQVGEPEWNFRICIFDKNGLLHKCFSPSDSLDPVKEDLKAMFGEN